MKPLIAILVAIILILQYKIWFGDGSMREVWKLQDAIESQKKENELLKERNAALEAEVKDLKNGLQAIEERARSELGMIKKGETFYQIIENKDDQPQSTIVQPKE